MEQIRLQGVETDYHEAFGSFRAAKNWFWWLLFVALLLNLVSFTAMRWCPAMEQSSLAQAALNRVHPTPLPPTQSGADTRPAAATQPAATSIWGDRMYTAMDAILPACRSVGVLCAVLLSVMLLCSLAVVLTGRLGGAGPLASATVWSILLAVLLMPWQSIFPDIPVPGAMYGLGELLWETHGVGGAGGAWTDQLLYYGRFLGYPLLVVLIWLIVQIKYAKGVRCVASGAQQEPRPLTKPAMR